MIRIGHIQSMTAASRRTDRTGRWLLWVGALALLIAGLGPAIHHHDDHASVSWAGETSTHSHHSQPMEGESDTPEPTDGDSSESSCTLCVLLHSARHDAALLSTPIPRLTADVNLHESAGALDLIAPAAVQWRTAPPRAPPQSIA